MNGQPQFGQAKLQFLTWLKYTYPDLFYATLDQAEMSSGNMAGLGAEEVVTTSFWSKISTGVLALGTTYLALKAQRDAMKLNLARAEQGLPPIDAGVVAPVIRTQIDLPPDVISKITSEAGANVNKVLIFAAVALGAMMLMRKR